MSRLRRTWTKEEDKELIQLIKAGNNSVAIQSALGRANSSVLKRAETLGHRYKGRRLRKYSDETLEQIRRLLREGYSQPQIGDQLGMKYDFVHYIVKRYGLAKGRQDQTWTPERDPRLVAMIMQRERRGLVSRLLHTTELNAERRARELFPASEGRPLEVELFISAERRGRKQLLVDKVRVAKSRCKKKEWEFEISYEYISELYERQGGLCYYTGKPMKLCRNDQNAASIDRLDSKKGYTKTNVVLCTWAINRMKQEVGVSEFLSLCKTIADRATMIQPIAQVA